MKSCVGSRRVPKDPPIPAVSIVGEECQCDVRAPGFVRKRVCDVISVVALASIAHRSSEIEQAKYADVPRGCEVLCNPETV